MKDIWMVKKCTGILNPVHFKMASEPKLNTYCFYHFQNLPFLSVKCCLFKKHFIAFKRDISGDQNMRNWNILEYSGMLLVL